MPRASTSQPPPGASPWFLRAPRHPCSCARTPTFSRPGRRVPQRDSTVGGRLAQPTLAYGFVRATRGRGWSSTMPVRPEAFPARGCYSLADADPPRLPAAGRCFPSWRSSSRFISVRPAIPGSLGHPASRSRAVAARGARHPDRLVLARPVARAGPDGPAGHASLRPGGAPPGSAPGRRRDAGGHPARPFAPRAPGARGIGRAVSGLEPPGARRPQPAGDGALHVPRGPGSRHGDAARARRHRPPDRPRQHRRSLCPGRRAFALPVRPRWRLPACPSLPSRSSWARR